MQPLAKAGGWLSLRMFFKMLATVKDLGDWGARQVSPCGFWSPRQTLTFSSMSKLSGEHWLMNSWYEFLTLLESRNMLMNSGRSPSICKVMTKVVMNYSWLVCSCSEAQQFIQHFWPSSRSPLHDWEVAGAGQFCIHSTTVKQGPSGRTVLSYVAILRQSISGLSSQPPVEQVYLILWRQACFPGWAKNADNKFWGEDSCSCLEFT